MFLKFMKTKKPIEIFLFFLFLSAGDSIKAPYFDFFSKNQNMKIFYNDVSCYKHQQNSLSFKK